MKNYIFLASSLMLLALISSCSTEPDIDNSKDSDYTFYIPFNNNLIEKTTSQNTISNTNLAFIADKDNKANSAVYFNGTQFIEYYGSESINLYRSFTLSCWVKPDNGYGTTSSDLQNEIHLFGRFTRAIMNTSSYSFNFLNDGRLSLRLFDSTMTNLTFYSNSVVPTNEWTHIAASFDGSTVKIYINGVQNATYSNFQFAQNSTDLFCVGARNFPGILTNRHYKGGLDEIKIFKRALSQTEVKELAK